ncbi:inactive ubiquitin carboxyl-terminal hydrolase MINDY-4B [Taeniopygia guttata]|uniref:inactive ubiquitin carboxyl-terminal hydrolase MINDY-4B n=1 Tax=Taeniopygia guttata TaxID=59729 RepID=UPI003BB916C9
MVIICIASRGIVYYTADPNTFLYCAEKSSPSLGSGNLHRAAGPSAQPHGPRDPRHSPAGSGTLGTAPRAAGPSAQPHGPRDPRHSPAGSGTLGTARAPGKRPPGQVSPGLRTPRLPVWLCSASGRHSVLFGTDSRLLSDWKSERIFHLYFYTGQQEQTRTAHLTIGTTQTYQGLRHSFASLGRGSKGRPVQPREEAPSPGDGNQDQVGRCNRQLERDRALLLRSEQDGPLLLKGTSISHTTNCTGHCSLEDKKLSPQSKTLWCIEGTPVHKASHPLRKRALQAQQLATLSHCMPFPGGRMQVLLLPTTAGRERKESSPGTAAYGSTGISIPGGT